MRKMLELQSDRIEAVLSVRKVHARVTGGTVTPRWTWLQVSPEVGVGMSRVKALHEEVVAALDASACRVAWRGAALTSEAPRDDPRPVHLLPLFRQLSQDGGGPLRPRRFGACLRRECLCWCDCLLQIGPTCALPGRQDLAGLCFFGRISVWHSRTSPCPSLFVSLRSANGRAARHWC